MSRVPTFSLPNRHSARECHDYETGLAVRVAASELLSIVSLAQAATRERSACETSVPRAASRVRPPGSRPASDAIASHRWILIIIDIVIVIVLLVSRRIRRNL